MMTRESRVIGCEGVFLRRQILRQELSPGVLSLTPDRSVLTSSHEGPHGLPTTPSERAER